MELYEFFLGNNENNNMSAPDTISGHTRQASPDHMMELNNIFIDYDANINNDENNNLPAPDTISGHTRQQSSSTADGGEEGDNEIEDAAVVAEANTDMSHLYSLFATRKAFANGEFVRNEFLPSFSEGDEGLDTISAEEEIISVTNKFPNHVVSAAVSYFPTAKTMTLAQTRKKLHMTARALPEDIKAILFTVDELPEESCKQATLSIIELETIFEFMDTTLKVHDKHSARAECTFWLEGPPAEEGGMPEQLQERISLALNKSILNSITVVQTTALCKQTMEVYELYMKPLSRFVENLQEAQDDESKEKDFFGTYSRGHIPAALIECAEIVLRYLQIGHPASSSILYAYLKNPEGDHLLQSPLSMTKACHWFDVWSGSASDAPPTH
jgi:hypothetical protein